MKPIKWRDDLRMYAENQPEYETLPVLDARMEGGGPVKISAWKPSFLDRLKILFGRPIFLWIHATFQPPVSVTTKAPPK